jgi:hypothetical protein
LTVARGAAPYDLRLSMEETLTQHGDLAEAWRCLKRLERLFAEHPGGREEKRTLAAVRGECASASRALRDLVFNDRLAELQTFAADLFSAAGHRKWARQEVTGPEYLRFQVYRTFNLLDTRLRMLRQIREGRPVGAPPPVEA